MKRRNISWKTTPLWRVSQLMDDERLSEAERRAAYDEIERRETLGHGRRLYPKNPGLSVIEHLRAQIKRDPPGGLSMKLHKKWLKDELRRESKKTNPARKTVRLKNFTGTIRKNPNGTVSIVGRAKKR